MISVGSAKFWNAIKVVKNLSSNWFFLQNFSWNQINTPWAAGNQVEFSFYVEMNAIIRREKSSTENSCIGIIWNQTTNFSYQISPALMNTLKWLALGYSFWYDCSRRVAICNSWNISLLIKITCKNHSSFRLSQTHEKLQNFSTSFTDWKREHCRKVFHNSLAYFCTP